MMITMLIINYVAAIATLLYVTDDGLWEETIRGMKTGKTLDEQRHVDEHQDSSRRILCKLLIVPGAGLVMIAIVLTTLLRK